ncbi:hypothetical protein CEQ90_19535 [Lewinellaceae bacterium SD302]|nr:hypothetical protein CEQ90_19535 [Lewinellaceae bacterium SD302]
MKFPVMTKRSCIMAAWLLLPLYTLFAQLIVTDPVVPQVDQPVTITFDATQGTGGLADCDCDVYLHTGVITDQSSGPSDWKYVPTTWGVANPDWQLTPVPGEPNLYTYTYGPSISGYFNVPGGENIEQIAFVFRNADGSLEGKGAGGSDIFVDVAQGGGVLSVNLQGDPGAGTVQPLGLALTVSGGSSIEAELTLFDNGVEVGSFNNDFTTAVTFTESGTHEILLEATSDDGQIATASFSVEAGLRLDWSTPVAQVTQVASGSNVIYNATSYVAADLEAFLNGSSIGTDVMTISGDILLNDDGAYDLEIVATYEGETFTDSRLIVVGEPNIQDPPGDFNNGITETEDGLYFQLYAEGKSDVYVIGNFNNWAPAAEARMNRSIDGKTFWVELSDLPEDNVIFQYYVDYQLRVADPFSELVLDPFNDPFISEATFAGIPDYPTGSTEGIVTWVRMNAPEFDWTDEDFVPVEEEKITVYELLIRDFLEDHSYKSLLDTLDYIQRLGVNAIELMPVNEFEGNISWGYNPSYHMALDKYYGSPEDLKAVINECHNRGMSVILDVVYNHVFSQGAVAQLWWDPVAFRPTEENPYLNVVATHPFNVGYDFNHESEATKDYVKTGLRYWIEEYHFDGYRFDLTKGFTQNVCNDNGCASQYDASRIAILKDYADEVWAADENAYVIFEHFAANSEQDELSQYGNGIYFWSGFNPHDEYLEASMGYPSNLNSVLAENRGFTTGQFLVGFMESHDEERMQYKNEQFGNSSGDYDVTNPSTGYDRVELASAFFYTLPGPKMLWQFGELAYDFPINYCPNGTTDPNCRVDPKPIRWDYVEETGRARIYNLIRNLLFLRNNYEVFHTEDYDVSLTQFGKRIHLIGEDIDAAIIGNFNVEPLAIANPFPYAGEWYNYLSTETTSVADPNAAITLEPGEYRIYLSEEVELPGIGLPVSAQEVVGFADFEMTATPNPTSGNLQLAYTLAQSTDVSVSLLDLSGRNLGGELISGNRLAGEQREQLNLDVANGIYFLRLTAGNRVATIKVVVNR